MDGASLGAELGGQVVHSVILLMNEKAWAQLFEEEIRLESYVSTTVGPIGIPKTNANHPIYTYTKGPKGFLVGANILSGLKFTYDVSCNDIYRRTVYRNNTEWAHWMRSSVDGIIGLLQQRVAHRR